MSTHPISAAADAAREAARQDNGQFGTQPKAESGVVDLLAGTAYDPRAKAMTMDADEFESMFGSHIEAPSGNAMWDFNELQAADIPTDRVWTVVENGENENLYALPGYHVVNKVDYLVTPQPWGNPDIEVLWHDENDMYDEERDGPSGLGDGGICPDCENPLTEAQAMDGHCPACADATDAQKVLTEETYSEFGDDQPWSQLNTTPALAPRTDAALARLENAARALKADPNDSTLRMSRNAHIEALAMSREGRMMLAGMSDEQLGGEFYGPRERESLIDHGKKKSTRLHAHFNKTALGAGATPVSVAEARRVLHEGAQVEVVYLQKHPVLDKERDFRVVASQSERSMETLRRGEASPVRNDWIRKSAMVDARDNIIVCDEFGVPYVAYCHV